MHTRLFLLLAGFGLFTGCGKDEHVGPLIGDNALDAGDETTTTIPSVSPATVGPATSASVNPAVNPAVNPGPITSKLAAACVTDSECGTGMTCLVSTGAGWFGGGPAKGFCTVDCRADADICTTVQRDATCIQAGAVAYCFPGCEPGGASTTKCQGRTDVACDYVSLDEPFCRPMCGTDADCDGRKCSIGNGVCVDEFLGTGEIGAPCNPDIRPSTDCLSGFCIRGATTETATTGTCSGLCTLGTEGCSVEGEPGNGQGWCSPFQVGSTAGDMGLCSQTCGCDDECGHESYRCLTFSPTASTMYGVEGLCSEFDTDTESLNEGFSLGKACESRPDSGADGGDGGGDAATLDAASDAAADAMSSLPAEASLPADAADAQGDAD